MKCQEPVDADRGLYVMYNSQSPSIDDAMIASLQYK